MATLQALAAVTGQPVVPLAAECGPQQPPAVALIDESTCIGCALCINACPIDAIIGAPGRMHTVLPSLCSGCELCVAPCPVDCITLEPVARGWTGADATAARSRHAARAERARAPAVAHAARAASLTTPAQRRAAITAALARARARRAAGTDA
jgi:electron transport complex protein RnfB